MIHYPAFRKTVKWYRKLLFAFLDMAVLNSSIIFMKSTGKKIPLLEFKSQIIYQMIETYAEQRSANIVASLTPHPFRLTVGTFQIYIQTKREKNHEESA